MGIDLEGDVDEIGLTLDPIFAQKSLTTADNNTQMTKFAKKRVRVDLNYLSKQLTTLKFSEEDHQCTFLVE